MRILFSIAVVCFSISVVAQEMEIVFQPEQYVCYRTNQGIEIDGKFSEPVWNKAPWTADFVDIQGDKKPKPHFRTRVKMLWDETYLYVAAELEEPDVWSTLTERESPLFQENNFEVFIDPSGDTHNYYEFEINALGTVWDLFMTKAYRDGGIGISAWDINGLKTAVLVNGSLNDPSTKDKGWIVEAAFPWAILKEGAPGKKIPVNGTQWRFNFARAEWPVELINGKYAKKPNPQTRKASSQFWTWSPQGVFNMHFPETWGFVQFSTKVAGTATDVFVLSPDESVKWKLRQLYYAQHQFKKKNGRFAGQLAELNKANISLEGLEPMIETTKNMFEITVKSLNGHSKWHIRQDGRVWKE